MARHTKATQGLLQSPMASLASTTISPPTSTWRNTKLARQPFCWLLPRFITERRVKLCPCCSQKSSEDIWEGSRSWACLTLHLKCCHRFWHTTKYSWIQRDVAREELHDYSLQMNRKQAPLRCSPCFTIQFALNCRALLSQSSKGSGSTIKVTGCLESKAYVDVSCSKTLVSSDFYRRKSKFLVFTSDRTVMVLNFLRLQFKFSIKQDRELSCSA